MPPRKTSPLDTRLKEMRAAATAKELREPQVLISPTLQSTLPPQGAPPAPAAGWTMFSDEGDSDNLKAIAADGTIVTLGGGTPPGYVTIGGSATLTNKAIDGGANTLTNIANAALVNAAVTIAGHSVPLGGSQALAASDLTNGVQGSGAVVLAAGAALTAPSLGAATATSINKVAITPPSSSATLTLANGKTLAVNNSLTLAGTDGAALTFQGSDTYVGRATTDTLTNKTFDAAGTGNALSNLATSMFAASVIDTDGTLAADLDTRIASQKAVKTYCDQLISAQDAMVFKGVQDCSSSPNYPAGNRGDTWRVSVAGKIGGASGVSVEIGDMFICLDDGTASGTQAAQGAHWGVIQNNIDGAVVGPASAVDQNLAVFSGATGKLIADGGKAFSTDGTLASNSDALIPTQKAVRAYADTKLANAGGTATGDIVMASGARLRPASSTVAAQPAVAATGILFATDEGGGPALLFDDGANHRSVMDGQVATATVGARGVLSCLSARAPSTLRTLVTGAFAQLDAAGLTSKLKGLWVHAMPNRTDAKLNWITPARNPLVEVGTLTFTANQGFTGDGSSGLLDTQQTLSAIGISSQDDVAAGVYLLAASASAAGVIGQNATGQGRRIYLQSATSGALPVRLSDTGADTWTPPRYVGLHVLSRVASSGFSASVDDTAVTAISRTSAAAPAGNICFLGTIDTGGSEFSSAKVAFSFLANGALSATDIANLRAILVDYFLVGVGAVSASVSNLPPAANFAGQQYFVSNLGGGAGFLHSDGTNWFRAGDGGAVTVSTDASFTWTPLTNARNTRHTGTLTADRTITLATMDAKGAAPKVGTKATFTRTGSGAFNLSIGGLKNLVQNTWCDVTWGDAGAWYLSAYGAL
jgi:hypothetical protein